jgi:hypothetical protein
MKWVNNIMPYGSKATGILPMLSKIALHGNFPLIIRHFISKITDCTQPSEQSAPSVNHRSFHSASRHTAFPACQNSFEKT